MILYAFNIQSTCKKFKSNVIIHRSKFKKYTTISISNNKFYVLNKKENDKCFRLFFY